MARPGGALPLCFVCSIDTFVHIPDDDELEVGLVASFMHAPPLLPLPPPPPTSPDRQGQTTVGAQGEEVEEEGEEAIRKAQSVMAKLLPDPDSK